MTGSPYVLELVLWSAITLSWSIRRLRYRYQGRDDDEDWPLLGDPADQHQSSDLAGNQNAALHLSSSSRETVWGFLRALMHGKVSKWEDQSLMLLLTILLFGLFVAQTIAGIISAKIASDRIGMSSLRTRGIWQFDNDAGNVAADIDDLGNCQKESRASHCARNCYETEELSPFSCRLFNNQSIAFTTKTHQRCPFPSPRMCLDGLYSAVTFDTGLVDASIVGVNSPESRKFRRTSSCSPLTMSEPYVTKV